MEIVKLFTMLEYKRSWKKIQRFPIAMNWDVFLWEFDAWSLSKIEGWNLVDSFRILFWNSPILELIFDSGNLIFLIDSIWDGEIFSPSMFIRTFFFIGRTFEMVWFSELSEKFVHKKIDKIRDRVEYFFSEFFKWYSRESYRLIDALLTLMKSFYWLRIWT